MYKAYCIERTIIEDDYYNGCVSDYQSTDYNHTMSHDTLTGLIHRLVLHYDTTVDSDCIHDNYLSINILEDNDGCKPSPDELEKWKKGEFKLWQAEYVYRFTVELDITEIELKEVLK